MSYVVTECNTGKVTTYLDTAVAAPAIIISVFINDIFCTLHGLYTIEMYLPGYIVWCISVCLTDKKHYPCTYKFIAINSVCVLQRWQGGDI